MTKFVIMMTILGLLVTSYAYAIPGTYSCRIEARKSMLSASISSEQIQRSNLVEDVHGVASVTYCIERAGELLDQRCLERSSDGFTADAVITYSKSDHPELYIKGLLRGVCTGKSLQTLLGTKQAGFTEKERFGFIERQ